MIRENGMVVMTEEEFRQYTKKDIEVTRKEFLRFYDSALNLMEMSNVIDVDNMIYGHDVTVHWNGIYCNCSDGATAYNYIIEGVKGVDDELDD